MYFAVSFHFQSFVFIAILLAAVSHALPLESRAGQKSVKLQDGLGCKKGRGPCICRNSNGPEVRLSSPLLLKQCGSFAFQSVAENGHILVGLVSLSYSKEFMSPNPHDLGKDKPNTPRNN